MSGAETYIAGASGRPEWTLWGKAQAEPTFDVPAHPLLCHMIDVAAVAERLLTDRLPRATRTRLVESLAMPADASVRWLTFIVALHDLGKATPPFQAKWPPATVWLTAAGFDVTPTGRDHGTLGVALAREVLMSFGVEELFAHRLARSVAAHHGTFPTDLEAGRTMGVAERGASPTWSLARRTIARELAGALGVAESPAPTPARLRDWAFFSALAGLTSVADWIGSMAETFRYEAPPRSLGDYLPVARERAGAALLQAGFRPSYPIEPQTFEELFGFAPRPLQAAIAEIVDSEPPPMCLIVEAPMGEGKTEAALYVSHALDARRMQEGTYMGLPTQATANQMFNRLSEYLTRTRPDQRITLRLLHGEAVFDLRMAKLLRAVDGPGDRGGLVCEPWFLNKKRALLAPFGAGTIDQALLSVLRTKHAFVRQLGLAGKTVVFDEVHAYDTYTSTLLERLVAWLGALGATVVMLSATLPSSRRRALLQAYALRPIGDASASTYPRISWVDSAGGHATAIRTNQSPRTMKLSWLEDDADALAQRVVWLATSGANVGVIRNTVSRAQDLFERIRGIRAAGGFTKSALLLHARFPVEDRVTLEELLMSRLGKHGARPDGTIVVGTQVLEQSLDIDFDALVTDLAPVDLILQRAGRLHRHDRPSRPRVATVPTLGIVVPEGDPESAALKSVARVYEPYVVRRTLLTLRDITAISLPADIEPLIDAVYEADEPSAWGTCLAAEKAEMLDWREEEELLAKHRVWRTPTTRDDPFANLEMEFTEDDPDVAKMLRAETRLGDSGAEIVCLFGSTEAPFLDRALTRPVDIARRDPTGATVRALAQRTVRLSTRGLTQAIADLPRHAPWSDVSLLAQRRPLFFGLEPLVVGRHQLQLDDELGLTIVRDR